MIKVIYLFVILKIATQMSTCVWINTSNLRAKSAGERDTPPNLPDKRCYGRYLWYHLLFQTKYKERAKHFTFSKIGIKTRLDICAEKVKITTYINNIPCNVELKRNYTDIRSLTRINLSSDNTIYLRDIKLPELIT